MSQTLIQSARNADASASFTLAYASNVTKGNLLTVLATVQGPGTTCTAMSITDTLGNVWTPVWSAAHSISGGGISVYVQGWFCLVNATGANTISWTSDAASVGGNILTVGEFSGFQGVATLDLFTANAVSGTAVVCPLTLNTSLSSEIVFGLSEENSALSTAIVLNSPYTGLSTFTNFTFAPFYGLVAVKSNTTLSGTWTNGATSNINWSAAFSVSAQVTPAGGDFLGTAGISTSLADINPARIESPRTSIMGTNLGTAIIG